MTLRIVSGVARNNSAHGGAARARVTLGVALAMTGVFVGSLACQPTDPPIEPYDAAGSSRDRAIVWESVFGLDAQLVARVGEVSEPRSVGPIEGDQLAGISRDAGVSAELSDGSVVWFFGDSALFEADGSMRFFEIGSAAWASAADPFVTVDHSLRGTAQPFAQPDSESPTCPPEAPSAGLWPLSSVVDPSGERDRVVIWMANICLGADRAAVGRGVSVGQWSYDPTDPPLREPVRVEILEPNLFGFDGPRFGDAILPDGVGGVYVYGCDLPEPPGGPVSGPCRVAWVDLADADDATAYRVWDGRSWTPDAHPADLEFTGADDGTELPSGPVSVLRDPGTGAVVMVYSPWPSYVPSARIRVASSPAGPFGDPTDLDLPGCDDHLQGRPRSCYAANVQSFLTERGKLGIGWYDQMLEPGDRGGTFVVASVPFEVRPDR